MSECWRNYWSDNFLYDRSIASVLNNLPQCAEQPFLSGNHQIDLLLRIHNWIGKTNNSAALTYKIATQFKASLAYQSDFWSNEGRAIDLTIKYLKNIHLPRKYTEIPDYILEGRNRGETNLLENNFANSFLQQEYFLNLYLINIKNKYSVYHKTTILKYREDLESLNSIYEIENIKKNIDDSLLKNDIERFFSLSKNSINKEEEKIESLIQYTFAAIEQITNVVFRKTDDNPQVNIFVKVRNGSQNALLPEKDKFYYVDGKTIHAELFASYYKNNESFAINYNELLHLAGHLLIDHPNDASIAIREDLFPPDNNFEQRKDYGIANQYRADNGCMSIMAFTSCFYQGKEYKNTLTYMPIDIQAMQYLYGKNNKTRVEDNTYIITNHQTFINSANSVYSLFPEGIPSVTTFYSTGNKKFQAYSIYTLYDAGGINTIDLSLIKEAKIDLNEGAGHFNVIGDNVFLIAYDTHIHNIIVERGNIEIKLNDLNNNITIPAKGAHVFIENFNNNSDHLILDNNISCIFDFSSCTKPYANIGDNITEICFI